MTNKIVAIIKYEDGTVIILQDTKLKGVVFFHSFDDKIRGVKDAENKPYLSATTMVQTLFRQHIESILRSNKISHIVTDIRFVEMLDDSSFEIIIEYHKAGNK